MLAIRRVLLQQKWSVAFLKPGVARALATEAHKIGFVTDVEGNLDFWQRQVTQSQCLERDDAGKLQLQPGCSFVYGGDCFDKGPGNIRIATELVGLKKRYPDRVFLLLGNRDVNKMRLRSDLHASDLARDPGEIPLDFWLPASAPAYSSWLHAKDYQHSTLHRLEYMLTRSMGAPGLMNFMREEMAIVNGRALGDISDMEVFEQLLQGIEPGGAFYEYIAHAQLGVCLGDTVFVHGAVTPASAGFVPSLETRCAIHDVRGRELRDTHSVQEWIDALNAFKDASWEHFCTDPLWNVDRSRRGGESLMAYAHSKAVRGRTAMVSNYFQQQGEWSGNLQLVDTAVEAYLNRSGVHRVVVGHKPFGDSPTPMRSQHLEIINCDTSFSDPTAPDCRGQAASEVCIAMNPGQQSQSHIAGTLADGRRIAFSLPEDPFIGRPAGKPTPDQWWIHARFLPSICKEENDE